MSLHVDTDALQNQTLPALNKSKENLNSAREIISSIDIPSDFRYASTIRKIINDMENTEKTTDKFYNYVNEKISRLSNAEKSNTNVVDNILKIDFNNEFDLVGAVEATGAVVKDKGEELLNNTINFINYVCSPDFLHDLENSIKETGTEIKENVKNFIQVSIETGAQIGTYVLNKFKENFPRAYNVGCKIVEGVKWLFSNVVVPLFKLTIRTAATVVNMAISFVEGLVKLIGSILDAVFIVGGGIVSVLGLVIDLAYWIYVKLTGNDDGYRPCAAKEIMEATMSIVAEQPVENAFRSFYENNVIGKNLDKYAFGPFKNAGTGSKIVQGIGEISGIVVLTIATMGIFGAVAGGGAAAGAAGSAAATSTTVSSTTATIGAVIKATSAFGKYTGQRWAESRDASWEGVERLHNNGEMSDDMYYSYITVRCLSEDEWKSIENDWIDGKITEEQYAQMKQIRELPEEWTTNENYLNGLVYGTSNAVWEGLQFYFGGKLASWGGIEGNKIVTSAIRVGVDTTFNAADTPFRALVDSATSNKSIKQAWQEQGGWASVFVDTGIGLVGSIGGEVIDNIKTRNVNIDETVLNKNNTEVPHMGNYNAADSFLSQYNEYELQNLYFFQTPDGKIIKPFSSEYNEAIQNGITLSKKGTADYFLIKNSLVSYYGMTASEASKFIEERVRKISNNFVFEYMKKYSEQELQNLYFFKTPDGKIIKPFSAEYDSAVQNKVTLSKIGTQNYFNIKDDLVKKFGMTSGEASKFIEGRVKTTMYNSSISVDAIYQNLKNYMSNRDVDGAANYLFNNTDIAYNKEKLRKLQLKIMSDTNDLGTAVDASEIMKKLIEKRGGLKTAKRVGNTNINVISNINYDNASVGVATVEKWLNDLPVGLRKNIKDVNIYDVYNPEDIYWKIRYKMDSFESAMTGGGSGKINIYTGNKMTEFCHEAGHCLDYAKQITNTGDIWKACMEMDQQYSKLKNIGISEYAQQALMASGTLKEDFAESVRFFMGNTGNFKQRYPNRFRILSKYIK